MSINPFKKSQMSKMENKVAALAKRGEQLAAKRVLAQKTLDDAIKGHFGSASRNHCPRA